MLPKFTQESEIQPIDLLKSLGINRMFEHLDLDIFDKNYGFASEIVQKVKIIVDEEGTEAAAVTMFSDCRGIPEHITFKADHPFQYYIKHIP